MPMAMDDRPAVAAFFPFEPHGRPAWPQADAHGPDARAGDGLDQRPAARRLTRRVAARRARASVSSSEPGAALAKASTTSGAAARSARLTRTPT